MDETSIHWSWDNNDGNLFRRFSRALPVEAWLVGIEYHDDISRMYGRDIQLLDGKIRKAKMIAIPFAFDAVVLTIENHRIHELMAAAAEFFPRLPAAEILEELWLLSLPVEPIRDTPRL